MHSHMVDRLSNMLCKANNIVITESGILRRFAFLSGIDPRSDFA
jgi:hypothetical protein